MTREQAKKREKIYRRCFSGSLLIIGCSALLLGVTNLFGVELPDWVTRVCGCLSAVSCLVMPFCCVKLGKEIPRWWKW